MSHGHLEHRSTVTRLQAKESLVSSNGLVMLLEGGMGGGFVRKHIGPLRVNAKGFIGNFNHSLPFAELEPNVQLSFKDLRFRFLIGAGLDLPRLPRAALPAKRNCQP